MKNLKLLVLLASGCSLEVGRDLTGAADGAALPAPGDASAPPTIDLASPPAPCTVPQTPTVVVKLGQVAPIISGDHCWLLYAAGKHDGPEIAFARPNEFMRVPDGKYDVRIDFEAGLAKKSIWIDSQAFSGKVERKVELGVKLAEPRISATLAGKDVGDNVRIAVITSAEKVELGDIRGGESILMEAGTYDFEASVPGFEGLLRNATVAGKPHLIVPLEPLKTAELKAGGPPPRACIIEVYGVNFDTAKSDLRPDSDSVLKAVLKLFAETPEFQAEIGGHTDDVGKPEYNQKLSQARAAAVKAWLVRHGIGAERVSSRGYGDARPLFANDSDENRFKNRRVELRRTDCR